MISTRAGSSTTPAPGFNVLACLLARDAICRVRHSRCRWVSCRAPIAFASGFETPMSIITAPSGFARRRTTTALSAANEPVLLATSTPENSGVACAMSERGMTVMPPLSDRRLGQALRRRTHPDPSDRPDPQPHQSALPDPQRGCQHDRLRHHAGPCRLYR